jgi:hypothetical protein
LIANQIMQIIKSLAHVGCARRKKYPRRRAKADTLCPLQHCPKPQQSILIEDVINLDAPIAREQYGKSAQAPARQYSIFSLK